MTRTILAILAVFGIWEGVYFNRLKHVERRTQEWEFFHYVGKQKLRGSENELWIMGRGVVEMPAEVKQGDFCIAVYGHRRTIHRMGKGAERIAWSFIPAKKATIQGLE